MKSCVVFGSIFEFSLLFFFTVGFVLSTAMVVATVVTVVVAVLAALRGLFRFIAGSASVLATGRLLLFAGHWVCITLSGNLGLGYARRGRTRRELG